MRLRWTWRVGKIAGIEIAVHPSWLITYALFAWSTTLVARMLVPQLNATSAVFLGLIASLTLFVSVVVHEFSHALVARRLGIPIGNIVLFLFGGVASILREPGSPLDELKMAGAGPAASIVIALVFGALAQALTHTHWLWGQTLCFFLAYSNAMIAAFNLLPMFPSDGGRLLRAGLWYAVRSQARATGIAAMVSTIIASGLILFGGYAVIGWRNPRGLWIMLIGIFLFQAALASARQARIGLALERMKVGDCMAPRLVPVPADKTVAAFMGEVVPELRQTSYPVVSGGDVVGMVSLHDTANLPTSLWESTPISSVMTALGGEAALSVHTSAGDALVALGRVPARTLPVYDDGILAGVVSEETIFGALRARDRTGTRAA
jgi:Zn-dependent protease